MQTRKVLSGFFLVIAIGVIITVAVFGLGIGKKYPLPSSLFYVNDYADVLRNGSVEVIADYGESVYTLTDDECGSQTQIVLATYRVESEAEIAEYSITDMYREWAIGENDMGILVVLFFTPDSNDENVLNLSRDNIQMELGYRMEQYVTTIELDDIKQATILTDDDLDVGVVHLYFELISIVLEKAYCDGFYPFENTVEEIEIEIESYDYVGENPSRSPMDFFTYLISPYLFSGGSVVYTIGFIIVAVIGGGVLFIRGAGGSSGGKGIRH